MDWLEDTKVTVGALMEAPARTEAWVIPIAHLVGTSLVAEGEGVCRIAGERDKVVLAVETGLVEVVV